MHEHCVLHEIVCVCMRDIHTEIDIQSGVKAFQAQSHGFYAQASTHEHERYDQNFQFSFAHCCCACCQHNNDIDTYFIQFRFVLLLLLLFYSEINALANRNTHAGTSSRLLSQ